MDQNIPVFAGIVSSLIFASSTFPMLYRAFRTKDLKSYSLSSMLLSNLGNLIHSLYVFSLPMGPIWFLHSFFLITSGIMLFWYIQYETRVLCQVKYCPQP